jgi:hypothetical protein
MKATCAWSGVLLVLAAASLAQAAGPACSQAIGQPLPQGPDCCNPGFYYTCPNGTTYGPNYSVRPYAPPWVPYPPGYRGANGYAGIGAGIGPQGGGLAVFPSHAYARSPRDYFMVGD